MSIKPGTAPEIFGGGVALVEEVVHVHKQNGFCFACPNAFFQRQVGLGFHRPKTLDIALCGVRNADSASRFQGVDQIEPEAAEGRTVMHWRFIRKCDFHGAASVAKTSGFCASPATRTAVRSGVAGEEEDTRKIFHFLNFAVGQRIPVGVGTFSNGLDIAVCFGTDVLNLLRCERHFCF